MLTRSEQLPHFGLVDDWTTRHVMFSNPGTAVEALAQGRMAQWYRIVNDPRYIMQQLKRSPAPRAAAGQSLSSLAGRPGAPAAEPQADSVQKRTPKSQRDWAVSLGAGTVAENMFPAKFTFYVNQAPSCANDFVVYGLNHTGATGGQGNVVAFNQLYSGSSSTSCSPYTAAQPYWAYNGTNHGGTVTTSVVLSLDGTKVIYVESTSTGSYLHVLVWKSADGGTPIASKAPANILSTGTGVSSCSSGSCLVTIALGSHSITNSSPFYDYLNDIVYVGDDNGTLYKVTPVLNSGTPSVKSLSVSSGNVLTGPVYDTSSGYVFVGGGVSGNLYAVTASSFSAVAGTLDVGDNSCSGAANGELVDPPIVDSGNGWVYEYVTDDPSDNTVVRQATTAGPFTTTHSATVGAGDSSCDSGTLFPTHAPAFDNSYYNSPATGHLWVCGRRTGGNSGAELWEVPTSGTNGALTGTPVAQGTGVINDTGHGQCSPFTEFYNTTSSTDYLFFGEGLSTFGDLYGFTLSTTGGHSAISGSPISYPSATGGTSGPVIDNVNSEAQASSIYFTTLGTSTTLCGSSSAYCAVKLTQSGLN